LSSGVWVTGGTSASVRVVDFSFTVASVDGGLLLDTSGSAVVWNITIAAGEASSVLLYNVKWISA
jgi:uncharacterized protein with LGFP repeats